MADFQLTGGCQCGAVRYRLHRPAAAVSHCHCSMCRKIHGAVYVSFAEVGAKDLKIEKGADQLSDYASSPGMHRRFCRNCGCHLFTAADSAPETVYLSAGTLDGGAHPGHPKGAEVHIFVGSKIPWYEITDDLPQKTEY